MLSQGRASSASSKEDAPVGWAFADAEAGIPPTTRMFLFPLAYFVMPKLLRSFRDDGEIHIAGRGRTVAVGVG